MASLSPHFVVETPSTAEKTEQKIAARDIHHLRIADRQTEALNQGEDLKRESEEGIRRLARLIREEQNRREKNKEEQPRPRSQGKKAAASSQHSEQKKKKVLKAYQETRDANLPDVFVGTLYKRTA